MTEDGQKYGGKLKPRFEADEFRVHDEDLPFKRRKKINVPSDLGEAVAFQIDAGTYRLPSYYQRMIPQVFRELAGELGVSWNLEYLAGQPHQYSTITALEQTVRVSRGASEKLTRQGGLMHRLFTLCSQLEGSKVVYSADNTEIVGYIHQLRLDRDAAQEAFPGRRRGFQLKSYHPKHVRKQSEDDPLYHPRVGVLFRKNLNGGTGVAWHDWPDLVRELEESLVNILGWAGIQIEPGPAFVGDDHFENVASHRDIALFDDPTPEIEREQNSIVVRVLQDATKSDLDVLHQLVADGGQAHYSELAEETEYSISTLYRALDRLGDVAKSDNGVFRFISEKVRQDLQELIDLTKRRHEQLEIRAAAIAKTLDIDPLRIQLKGSALQQWLTTYAGDLNATDGERVLLKFQSILDRLRSTSVPRLQDVLDQGLSAWRDAGLDPDDFYNARVKWTEPSGEQRTAFVRSLLA